MQDLGRDLTQRTQTKMMAEAQHNADKHYLFVINVIHNVIRNVISYCNFRQFLRNLLPFSSIMNDERSQVSVMNDIVTDKNGHNIVNDVEQLCISQTDYLLFDASRKQNINSRLSKGPFFNRLDKENEFNDFAFLKLNHTDKDLCG